jgi:hypothetical protein
MPFGLKMTKAPKSTLSLKAILQANHQGAIDFLKMPWVFRNYEKESNSAHARTDQETTFLPCGGNGP